MIFFDLMTFFVCLEGKVWAFWDYSLFSFSAIVLYFKHLAAAVTQRSSQRVNKTLEYFSAVSIKPVTFCLQVALKHLGHLLLNYFIFMFLLYTARNYCIFCERGFKIRMHLLTVADFLKLSCEPCWVPKYQQ